MTTRKKIKWILLGTLGLGVLLFLTLVIHIAVMVYHKAPLPYEHIQMARVDFIKPLDGGHLAQVKQNLQAQKGVKSTYFNAEDHNVVYTFDNRQNNAKKIYEGAIAKADIMAKPYVVTAKDLENGCPVMNTHSFYGRLTSVISTVVN